MSTDSELSSPRDYLADGWLPPIEEGLDLLHVFFDQFNRVIPLFDQPSFMCLTQLYYTDKQQCAPVWWAAVNVALAIAYRLHAVERRDPGEEKKAWCHLRNALRSVNAVILSDPELLSVQVLLGMVILLQGTPNPHPASTLVAAAVRLSQSLGLHRQSSPPSVDAEQRRHTFWIAYQLDKDCSMHLRKPSAQSDDDMDVSLPSEDPNDGIGVVLALDGSSFCFFRHYIELSIILGRIYASFHSVQALQKSPKELCGDAEALDRSLSDWTRRIPASFRPENMTKSLPNSALLHMVILYLSYFNCLSQLHSVTAHPIQVGSSGLKDLAYPQSSTLSCGNYVIAARAALHLVELVPMGNYACTW